MPKEGRRRATHPPAASQYELLRKWGLRAAVALSALVGVIFALEQVVS